MTERMAERGGQGGEKGGSHRKLNRSASSSGVGRAPASKVPKESRVTKRRGGGDKCSTGIQGACGEKREGKDCGTANKGQVPQNY